LVDCLLHTTVEQDDSAGRCISICDSQSRTRLSLGHNLSHPKSPYKIFKEDWEGDDLDLDVDDEHDSINREAVKLPWSTDGEFHQKSLNVF